MLQPMGLTWLSLTLTKRLVILWRILRVAPRLETIETTLPQLESLESSLPKVEAISAFLPKIKALEKVIEKLDDINDRTPPDFATLESIIPNLESLDVVLDRLNDLEKGTISKVEAIENFIPKIEALKTILLKLGELNDKTPEFAILEIVIPKMETLNKLMHRLEDLKNRPEPEVHIAHKAPAIDNERKHEWDRLILMTKFINISERAKEIETEWQKIQQDEHDAFFNFQVFRGENAKEYAYKKGVSDGIKWLIDRFS